MLFWLAAHLQEQPPIVPVVRPGKDGRGRDPWVFRCIFEDRTRMVLIAPASDTWMAFNPETCAMHKVWQGKMDFRGKVWDFSQNNSRAEGRILFAAPSEIARLTDGSLPAGWTSEGLTSQSDGWTFTSSTSRLMSPPINAEGWQRVFAAFDETGKKGRFRIDIKDTTGEKAPQWFESATSVDSETNWQWNFKRIERPSRSMTIGVTTSTAGKRFRNFRLYGDRPSWFDDNGRALSVRWGGYVLTGQTKAVELNYKVTLATGQVVNVSHRPEVKGGVWSESITLDKLPTGVKVVLRRDGLSSAASDPAPIRTWTFDSQHQSQMLSFTMPGGLR